MLNRGPIALPCRTPGAPQRRTSTSSVTSCRRYRHVPSTSSQRSAERRCEPPICERRHSIGQLVRRSRPVP
jgi:hypothetical protein